MFLCEILCKCIYWLIIKVILRNARCNNMDIYICIYIYIYIVNREEKYLTQQFKFVSSVQEYTAKTCCKGKIAAANVRVLALRKP